MYLLDDKKVITSRDVKFYQEITYKTYIANSAMEEDTTKVEESTQEEMIPVVTFQLPVEQPPMEEAPNEEAPEQSEGTTEEATPSIMGRNTRNSLIIDNTEYASTIAGPLPRSSRRQVAQQQIQEQTDEETDEEDSTTSESN
eukprot:Awhi_evm1s4690